MQSAICLLSVVPMRKEPSHCSEMVSQVLFGEYVTLGEEKEDFVFVTCQSDGYQGWVQANQLTTVADEQVLTTSEYIGVFTQEVFVNGRRRLMPFAIPVYSSGKPGDPLHFGNQQVSYKVSGTAVWNSNSKGFSKPNLDAIIQVFLDTPYLWGGKSIYGIDCSGFAQQVFKLFGLPLLRDAYLQAEQGTEVKSLKDARLGDLVFFQNEKGRIMHVGILLENKEIVHASGKVRIDTIDEEGIFNRETGKRTHRFHSIRRFF
ncbi:C40 family peptidase [Flavisolibacter nicotianae]|uniref:C40 family peptidase n=1 Tax=Flavisolibacter nicotianae TaxID=2364882 RepID=UPI0013C4CCDD|nr:C40 family peptidase [Flavisolibacter nicotianae]